MIYHYRYIWDSHLATFTTSGASVRTAARWDCNITAGRPATNIALAATLIGTEIGIPTLIQSTWLPRTGLLGQHNLNTGEAGEGAQHSTPLLHQLLYRPVRWCFDRDQWRQDRR